MKYRVIRGSILARNAQGRKVVLPAPSEVPEGALTADEIAGYLKGGRIAEVVVEAPDAAPKATARGPWTKDPSGLSGMDLEALLSLVLEIDPDYPYLNNLCDEAAAIRQLTEDWAPQLQTQTVASSSDRTELHSPGGDESKLARARKLATEGV